LVTFKDGVCKISKKGGMVIRTILWSMHGMYKVEHTYTAAVAPECVSLHLLHWRLVHIAPNTICALIGKGAVEGVKLIDDHTPLICDSCEHVKSTCKPIRKECEAPLAKAFGDKVHSDLWGPMPIQSMGKWKYYITFTDNSTCYTHLTALHSKDKALNAYKDFTSWANT
jgi:hypothetical protein